MQFASGDSYCSAWLYIPDTASAAPVPVVVMGHGLGATREMGLAPYAERFAAAGLAVLVFTYRNLGDSGGGPRQVLSMTGQLSDWDAALEYAANLPEVDRQRVAVWGSSLGGGHAIAVAARHPELRVVEWFDLTIYSTFAVYFSPLFFPATDPTVALLSTFAVFAVGFFVRPLGGWLLGGYADRRGRKRALTLTILLMTGPTLIIGISPTYATIGVAAPIILVAARMIQSFAAGGETGSAMAYLSEIAHEGRRGLYTSFLYTTVVVAIVGATLLGYLLAEALSAEALGEWGWRIPFLIGGVAGLIGLWVRSAMVETADVESPPTAEASAPRRAGLVALLVDYPRETFSIVLLVAGPATAWYTFVSYMPTHLIKSVGLSATATFGVHTVALVVFMVLLPLFGHLSDKIGRRSLGLIFSIGGAAVIVPLSLALSDSWVQTLVIDVCLLMLTASIFSVLTVLMTERFPTRMRAMGVGAPYNLTVAIFGGTAPFLLTWLASNGHADWYFVYVATLVLLTTLGLIGTRRKRT
ncbi:MFS transporter [Streptomyces sp. NPDC050619]|uniref:MFS transporter n=1 Tax=Streptomyces sp. NPDC050619 TaxID=3157214 RepID=UPI0034408E9A